MLSSTQKLFSPKPDCAPLGNSDGRDEYDVLASRFSFLQELQPAEKIRCFVVQDHSKEAASVALMKLFSADGTDEPSRLLAFLLEAHAAAKLSHPNIAASHKPEQLQGLHFCISDYQEDAETLGSRLNRQGWFEVAQALDIAAQIIDALEHAHQAEILHLKLHPGTLRINPQGKVWVTDFGIPGNPARPWAYQHRARQCPLAYRSPEQLSGLTPDERSDLFSLGVLLYEMLTDVLPFQAADEEQLRQKIRHHRVPAPHLLRPDIPESLSLILAKLLADDPAERFENASALRSALAGLAPQAKAASNPESLEVVTTSEWDEQNETEPLSFKFEEDQDFLTYEFDNDRLNSPLALDDTPEETLVDEHATLNFVSSTPDEASASVTESFASEPQPSDREDREMASLPFPQEAEALPTTDSLSVRQPLPFFLLALGIVLITAVIVLAYKGYFLGSPSVAAPEQTGAKAEAVIAEGNASSAESNTSSAESDASSAESDASSAATPPAQVYVEPDAAKSLSQATDTRPSEAAPARPATKVQAGGVKPDTARLRQQLRQQNREKVNKYKVKRSYARSVKAGPRKGIFRWRFW
jgi:serine/threonine protein kinase